MFEAPLPRLIYGLGFFTLALNWLDFTVVAFSFMELLALSIPGSSTVPCPATSFSSQIWDWLEVGASFKS